MAGHDLIDTYLTTIRSRLAWRTDADDVVDELRDHLDSHVERLVAAGVDRERAQQQAIDHVGEPSTVAVSFAATGSRGLAVPTGFTQSAGVLALVAAGAWLLLAAAWSASLVLDDRSGFSWDRWAKATYMIGASALLAAATMTTLVLVALHQRHGGLGVLGAIAIGTASLGAAAGLIGWFVYGWGLLLGVGILLATTVALHRGLAPRRSVMLLGVASPIGWAVGVTLWAMEVGPRDPFGDYPLGLVAGLACGCLTAAIGLVGIGRWLHREEPVDAATIRLASGS